MTLIIAIDFIVVGVLVAIALTKGLEEALPFFAFALVLLPSQVQFQIPGLFTVFGQRVAVVTLAVLYFILKKDGGQSPVMRKTPLVILMVAHTLWCVISTANSIVPGDSLKKLLHVGVEYYLMYYILVKTITQVKTLHRIMGAMVFGVFVACILGSFEAYSGWRITSLFPYVPGRFSSWGIIDYRFASTFTAPHLFGAAIAFAIIEVLYLLTLAKTKARKVYLWIALLIMFLNIYKLVTRGPWLTLIIGLCLLVAIGEPTTRKRLVFLAAISVAVVLIRPGVYNTIKNLYLETADTSNADNIKGSSYEYRYALWHVSLDALEKSAGRELWGYGLESFYELHLKAPFYNNPEYPFESCDSSWVEVTVETGFVGLFIFAILLLKPTLLIFRDMRRLPKPEAYLSGILFINVVQYLFMMTTVGLYAWGQTSYMLWMYIAMGVLYKPLLDRERAELVLESVEPKITDYEIQAARADAFY